MTALGARQTLARLLIVVGPGLVVMLADTDAGSLITAAQSGAQWGYKLLPLQLALIPVLFIVQEPTVRLGLVTGKGHGELILQRYGRGWAILSVSTLAAASLALGIDSARAPLFALRTARAAAALAGREAMAVDTLDSCGIYFGTTGGQVYASSDSGDHWSAIVRDLPAVLSVEVQTLP